MDEAYWRRMARVYRARADQQRGYSYNTERQQQADALEAHKPLVDEIRSQFGGRALSASINELLYAALAQERLGELVDEMEEESGAASPEAYERVLAQWFAEG